MLNTEWPKNEHKELAQFITAISSQLSANKTLIVNKIHCWDDEIYF